MNRIAYLLAGMALGAAGVMLAKDKRGEKILKATVQGGHDMVEKVLGKAETIKEDVEDYLAEAKYRSAEKARAAKAEDKKEEAATEEKTTA